MRGLCPGSAGVRCCPTGLAGTQTVAPLVDECDVAFFTGRKISTLAALQPEFRAKIELLMAKLAPSEHNFEVYESLRKISDECGLANPSVSKADPCKNPSKHAYGAAVDIVPDGTWVGPWRTARWPGWDDLRAAAHAVGLSNDISWDRPHVDVSRGEVTRWLQKDLGVVADGAWGPASDARARQVARQLGVAWMQPVPSTGLKVNWRTYYALRCKLRRTGVPPMPSQGPFLIADSTPAPPAPPEGTVPEGSLGPCGRGQAGACINTLTHYCAGLETVSGLCPGTSAVRCCPDPGGAPVKYVPGDESDRPCVSQVQLADMFGGTEYATHDRTAELNAALFKYHIDSGPRVRHFVAQIAHESWRGQFVEEIWGRPPSAAQARYEGRLDLGNTQAGDGFKFRGGGYIQLTGRSNYQAFADYIGDPKVMDGAAYVGAKYVLQ